MSLCTDCGEQGLTRLPLTSIPHSKEVVLMAFGCPRCHFRNCELVSVGTIADKGCTSTVTIAEPADLNRQLVRSEFATVRLPAVDFEVPPSSEHGSLTTVEGLLRKCIDDLQADQPARALGNVDQYTQIAAFLEKMRALLDVEKPFELTIEDPSGNSYIENPYFPRADPRLSVKVFARTPEQNELLGLPPTKDRHVHTFDGEESTVLHSVDNQAKESEVFVFSSLCSQCQRPTNCKMHPIDIPYFKEVIIMATVCDHCGFRTSEVKAGGAIEPQGKRIELKITDPKDLARDVIKSDSCRIIVPELALELYSGTLGSRFTTIEGLLELAHDELKVNPFLQGATAQNRDIATEFLAKLKRFAAGEILGTFIMDDPLGCSYLQNIYAPDPDPNMTVTEYERSYHDNEQFGLNDMNTE